MADSKKIPAFSRYEKFIIVILAVLQFTVILDFMVLNPLGALLMPIMKITPSQFGLVVSAYAFSAGISGLLAAGFADKYDRKKMLVFFYAGFVIGTILCGIAPDYYFLLGARVITGIFGGVLSSISFAIITDLFPMEKRGRVMGFVQMAFAVSQVMGIPLGLYLANEFDWHSPFLVIAGLAAATGIVIMQAMKPVNEHLKIRTERNAFVHFGKTLQNKTYVLGFAATALLSIGGFLMMPFSSHFLVRNVKISELDLPKVFFITGILSMISGPLVGKLSDKIGKYPIFVAGSILLSVMVIIYTNLGVSTVWIVALISSFLFVGVTSRMISASALTSAVPEPADRGAFMGINSSIQQISGGLASVIGGLVIVEKKNGPLEHFDTLGYLAVLMILICIVTMHYINQLVKRKAAKEIVREKIGA
jgi:predicted MFS family arabinose efflux permease